MELNKNRLLPSFLLLLFCLFLADCGVKGPPLPPIPTIPQASEKNTPSPSPSLTPSSALESLKEEGYPLETD